MSVNGKVRVQLGAPMPPRPRVVAVMLRPALDGTRLRVLALGSKVWGCQCHWDGTKLVLHFPAPLTCMGCLHAQEIRWVGFLACQQHGTKRRGVLCVTREAVEHCRCLAPEVGPDLRGRLVTVWRDSNQRGKPYRAEVSEDVAPTHVTPPDFSLARALECILGYPTGTLCLPDDGTDLPEEHSRYDADDDAEGGDA